jgi:uncharacterized membrane protein YhiD involved in acid resistance
MLTLSLISGVGMLACGIMMAMYGSISTEKATLSATISFIAGGVYFLTEAVVQTYCLTVVVKALRYLRNELLNPASELPRV